MANILKIDNKINVIPISGLTKVENSVFFGLLYKLQAQGKKEITLSFLEIKNLIGLTQEKNIYIQEVLQSAGKKLIKTAVEWERADIKEFGFTTIFDTFKVIKYDTEPTIVVKISNGFSELIENIKNKFTLLELTEFSALSSRYAQTLYRLLKQYDTTGFVSLDWNQFLIIMDAPKSYAMRDIEKRILKPAIQELGQETSLFNSQNPIFKKLCYKKTRGQGRGRPVVSIQFFFEPRNATESQKENLEVISLDIKKESILKQIRANKQHNPLTGKEVDWSDEYINRHFKVKNLLDGGYDSCKIKSITQKNNKITVTCINQENNKIFIKEVDNQEHFKNWFSKSLGL